MSPEERRPVWPILYYLSHAMPDRSTAVATSIAFYRLTEYAQFAHVQVERIRAHIAVTKERSHPEQTDFPGSPDVHYYFILWDTVRRMMDLICDSTHFAKSGKIRRKYNRVFEHYKKGRDDLEHFADRMPGQRAKKARGARAKKPRPIILDSAEKAAEYGIVEVGERTGGALEFWRSGWIEGETYHFAGLKWDVGPSGADQLITIAAEFVSAVFEEARSASDEYDKRTLKA